MLIWIDPISHLHTHDTEAPHICTHTILLARLYEFWSHVSHVLCWGETKVPKFDFTLSIPEIIGRVNVSMNYILIMEEPEALKCFIQGIF